MKCETCCNSNRWDSYQCCFSFLWLSREVIKTENGEFNNKNIWNWNMKSKIKLQVAIAQVVA
jgi:hypothetical protein